MIFRRPSPSSILRLSGVLAGFLLAAVFLFPSLTGARLFFPADILIQFPPWNRHISPELHKQLPLNEVLYDIPVHFGPTLLAVREAWQQGEWPVWNPYFRSGAPLLANMQSGPFAVTNLPHWILPFPYSFAWTAVLKFGIVWAGAWLFASRLGLAWPFRAAVAVGFSFSPGLMSWFQHPNGNVLIYLPWFLWSAEYLAGEWASRGLVRAAAPIAVVQTLALFGGHFHAAFDVSLAGFVYVLVRLPWRPARQALRLRAAALAAFLAGVFLAAPVVFPVLEFLAQSSTLRDRAGSGGAPTGEWTLPAEVLKLYFHPFLFGSHVSALGKKWSGHANWAVAQQYIGIVPLALAGFGLVVSATHKRWPWRPMLALAAVGWIGGSMAFGWMPLQPLLVKIPPFSLNTNPYMAILLQGSLVAISCLLWRGVPGAPERENRRLISWIALAAAVVLLLAVAASGFQFHWRPLLIVAATGAALFAWFMRQGPVQGALAGLLLPLLWACDVLPAWKGYHNQVPAEWLRPETFRTKTVDRLKSDGGRVIAEGAYAPNTLAYVGLSDVRAYDYPIHVRHTAFNSLFRTGRVTGVNSDNLSREHLRNPRVMRALSHAAGQWVLTQNRPDAMQHMPYLRPIMQEGGIFLYENLGAAPFAQWVPGASVVSVPDTESALSKLDNVPLTEDLPLVIEASEPVANVPSSSARVSTTVQRPTSRRIEMTLSELAPAPGYLVVRESYDRGWKAMVDGKPVPVLPAQIKFMAVPVAQGAGRVVLSYLPTSFVVGLWILAGSLAALGLLVYLSRPRRRKPEPVQAPPRRRLRN